MPSYSYTAYDRTGKKIKGIVESSNEARAIAELASKGFIVIDIKQKKASEKSKKSSGRSLFSIQIGEMAVFCRQFSTMISAGVRIKEALNVLSNQEVFSRRFRRKLEMVNDLIESGKSLSEAFEEVGGFEPVFINLVKAGEEGGALDRVMDRLATFYESSKELSDEVKASMRYPMFIGGFAVLVVFAMMFYIIPMLIQSIGLKPTGFVGSLVSIKNFMVKYAYEIVIGTIVTIIGLKFYLATTSGRKFKEKMAALFPPIRKIQTMSALERFARTMSILISAGVSLTTAVEMAAQATGNRTFEEKAKRVVELIKEGRSLRDAMAETKFVPQLVYEMAGTGETTGKIDEVMDKVATFYEQQLRIAVKKFVSLLEPMMIVFVGGVIAFIALSIYSTIFSYQASMGSRLGGGM